MKKTLFIAALIGIFLAVHSIQAQDDGSVKAPWESRDDQSQSKSEIKGPPHMMMGGGGAVITVSHGSIFVLMGNRLLKFNEKTMQIDNQVILPGREEPQGGKPPEKNSKENRKREEPDQIKDQSQGFGRSPMHGPMMGGGGGTAMTAADGFLFVVSQGKLFKYSDHSLELQGSAELQPPPPRGDDQGFPKSKDQPPERD